jgi:predicted Zn-ribbon and HTH transcriptional regulator
MVRSDLVLLKTSLTRAENTLAMAHQTAPVCFTCGLAYDRLHFNRLRNGAVCPTCRDRILDELPSLLPSRSPQQVNEEAPAETSGSLLRALPRLSDRLGDQERL